MYDISVNVLMRFCVEASEAASASQTCRFLLEERRWTLLFNKILTIHSTSSFQ